MTITMFLPWPSADLSPNARLHWRPKAKAAKKARETAWAIALEAKAQRIYAERVRVRYTFHPADKRRRDLDNVVASCKNYGDGIADAIGIDDSKWTVSYSWGEVVPGGSVRVDIEAIEERAKA